MKKYVLAFAFNEAANKIVLIEKQNPEWQRGKLNGVGGKIEKSETAEEAIVREFFEETGVCVNNFESFGGMVFENDVMGGQAIVYLFRIFDDKIFECKTVETEKICIVDTVSLPLLNTIPNLQYLINAAKDRTIKNLTLSYE